MKGKRRTGLITGLTVIAVAAVSLAGVPALRAYFQETQVNASPGKPAPVIAAAGDIACSTLAEEASMQPRSSTSLPTTDGANSIAGRPPWTCAAQATSQLLDDLKPDAVLALGDLQYECGAADAFTLSYQNTWGRWRAATRPVPGNNEYGRQCGRNDARPYFDYFGAAAGPTHKGWYSFDLGDWHLIALNSECTYGDGADAVGGCDKDSEQGQWLHADLASHNTKCTLAFWHEPRFSSGPNGSAWRMSDMWNELATAGADIILSANNHLYERFDPIGWTEPDEPPASSTPGAPQQQPSLNPSGIRQFIVGTGGRNHDTTSAAPLDGETVRNDDTFGVLSLTLNPNSYNWKFTPIKGASFSDAGTGDCH